MKSLTLSVLVAIAAYAAVLPAHAGVVHRYTVVIDPTLEHFDVSACFDGAAPAALVADDSAVLYLQQMQLRDPDAGKLEIDEWRAKLTSVPDNACVDYAVQLRPKTRGQQTGGPETRRIGRDLLTSIGDWLWRPAELAPADDIEVRFQLPEGVSVSAPWQQTGNAVFRTGTTPQKWPGVVAIGGFEMVAIEIPGARLNVALIDSPTPAQRDVLSRWIQRSASALTTVYGEFPVSQLQVVVVPVARGSEPVPWAYVARGGGMGVHLFVRSDLHEAVLMRDWTAVHEMSHLLLPYLESGDGWLVEGLPTYYQNVAMARGGLISPEEAWRRMYQGFESARQVGGEFTVYEAGQHLGRRGLYRRVYWGGAAYMLAVDLRLRETTGGAQTLGSALQKIQQCCLNEMVRWQGEDFVTRLDEVTGTRVFSETFEEQIKSRPFPEYDKLFERLGIHILGGHPIFVDGVSAQYRNAIMAPR